jgi:RNA methyltransferase, TrmH family
VITSTSNPHVKHLRSLATDPQERRRERCFVLEGVRLVATALDADANLEPLLFAPEQLEVSEAGRALLDTLRVKRIGFEASPRVVAAASDTQTPQGVVAASAWPELAPRRPGLVLLLDAVQDPGNMGTLLRSAEAVGAAEVWCMPGCADVYGPKVVRAAMGTHFFLPLRVGATWDDVDLMALGVDHIYAADADGTMPYYAADWRQPSALIIGNEAHGIGAAGLAVATKRIAIPMAGRAESLNAAVAGSVVLFEALRQRTRGRS